MRWRDCEDELRQVVNEWQRESESGACVNEVDKDWLIDMLGSWVNEKFGLEPDSLQSIATQDDGGKETSNGACPDQSEV